MKNIEKNTLSDIRNQRIVPFEIEDESLRKLFSYFLYKAPSINSASAPEPLKNELDSMWSQFIKDWDDKKLKYKIYEPKSEYPNEKKLRKYGLSEDSIISRSSRAFICFKKDKLEQDMKSLLRHIRNAIAHGHVYLLKKSKRKYILFEDYNYKGSKKRASILFSQTDLQNLKKITKT